MALPDDIDVEEQYRDILTVVNEILPYFDPYPLDNNTAAGRTKGELMLLKQEVEAKRFPIPANKGKVATINYHAHNKYLPEELPDFTLQFRLIVSLVMCNGVIKLRHYPRMIEMMVTHLKHLERVLEEDILLTDKEKSNLLALRAEMKKLAMQFHTSTVELPLRESEWPAYSNKSIRGDIWSRNEIYSDSEFGLDGPLMSRWRPRQSQPSPGWEIPDWVKNSLDNDS